MSNPDELKPIVNNTLYLLNLSAEYLVKNDGELSNVPLIKSIQDDSKVINPDEMMIIEQYDMIQKVTYDIFKLSEKIKI